MIIALTGEKLAGKGTVADYLVKTKSAQVVRFSQPLTDILHRLYQPNTRQELVALGTFLRQRFGNDVLVKVVINDLNKLSDQLVIVDGMRYLVEYEACAKLPDFYLLNITAPIKTRYDRTKFRQEKVDEANMTLAEFEKKESDQTEQEITLVQQHANFTIHNTGTLDDLYNQVNLWCATL
ncbi:MAG: hypothetical protein WCV88_04765 [Patescibacteria group bacterium]|jgi:dephospho-CoA kinase